MPKAFDIAVLGPQNTYSDLALKKLPKRASIFYAPSIAEVFEMVESGKAKEGLVPLENTLGGSVRETLDELYAQNVHITKVVSLPIHLALVAAKNLRPSQIATLYSHPQPFLQCRKFIKKSCPKAAKVPMESTVSAIFRAKDEPTSAAIASAHAARQNGLIILKEGIEDSAANTTHFALIQKGVAKPKPSAKCTSVAFHFKKDSPSSLYHILREFAERGINLSKIESRPSLAVPGQYVFYLDFDGSATAPKSKAALTAVKASVARLKVLGSY